MPTLYAHAAAGRIEVNQSQAVVTDRQGQPLVIAPFDRIEAISLASGVEINSSAIVKLLRDGKTISFVDGMDRWAGVAVGSLDHGVSARIDQFRAYLDPTRRLRVAKHLVREKIRHQHAHLTYQRVGSGCKFKWREYLASVDAAESLDALRGIEGSSSRTYFGLWFPSFSEEFRSTARTRRPPLDPLNALLSYGYTLLAEVVLQHIVRRGLDPYVGFLHEAHHSIPALVMDLMEPFRASLTDRWVARVVGLNIVHADDFDASRDGTRIRPGVKPALLKQWREGLKNAPLRAVHSTSRSNATSICSAIEGAIALMRAPC